MNPVTTIYRAAHAAHLPEGDTRPVEGPVTVLVAGDTIVDVLDGRDAPVPADTVVAPDAGVVEVPDDQVLIPGLVDTHVQDRKSVV